MKSLFFCLTFCLATQFSPFAQAQTDSLSSGDTISLNRQRIFLSVIRTYRYHLASGLTSRQLVPFLKRSPGEDVGGYIQRYKWQQAVGASMTLAALPVLTSSIFVARRKPELAGGLLLGSFVMVYAPLFLRPERNMERAVLSHNLTLRSQSGDYYRPMFDLRPQSDRLTLADSVQLKGSYLYPKFIYRGLRVDPATNLKTAFEYLNSGRINANMRYIRTVRGVSGFVSGLAASTLTAYLLYYMTRRSNGPYPVDRGIIYPALGTIGLSIIANWHVNRQQVGTMREYNLKIKER